MARRIRIYRLDQQQSDSRERLTLNICLPSSLNCRPHQEKYKCSDRLGIIDPLMCKNTKETEIRPFAYFQLVATCVISFSFLAYFLVLFLVFRNSLTGLVFFFYLRDAETI